MTELDKLVHQYYSEQNLSEGRVAAMQKLASESRAGDRIWYVRLGAVAAVLLVMFGFAHVQMQSRNMAELVFDEIAMNHEKQLAVEYTDTKFDSLVSAMDRLDFAIAPPVALMARFDLIGGRYCSIQGGLAAQLKVRDRQSGAIHTLYATEQTNALGELGARMSVHDGVRINVWSEQGVFFGLAESHAG